MRKIAAISSVLALSAFSASVWAFPFATSFESPVYSPGGLSGQDGWTEPFGGLVVQNVGAGARSGSQAVRFTTSSGTGSTVGFRSFPPGVLDADASVYVNVLGNSGLDYGFGLDVAIDPFANNYATVLVLRNGDVYTTGTVTSPGLVLRGNVGSVADRYVQVRVMADTVTKSVMAVVAGTAFALPSLTVAPAILSVDLIALNVTGASGSGIFADALFDDYSVQAVPEPGVLLVLAGLALAARRRNRG